MASSGRIATTWNSGVLKYILGGTSMPAVPVGMYIGLDSTTATADNGSFVELSGGSYARATIHATNSDAAWSAVTSDATGTWRTNAGTITFPTATGNWTAATGFRMWDASTNGTANYWGTFAGATTVGNGATASFAIGAITITES